MSARAHDVREDLEPPRRGGRAGRADAALHRSSPAPRGLDTRLRPARPIGPPPASPRGDVRHRRSLRADREPLGADSRSGDPRDGGGPRARDARARHRVPRPRRPAAGHRARDRPRAGLDAAGHHAGLRRLAHLDPRRARRARLRHRVVRGRARDGDAVPLAEEAAGHARQRHGRATRGRRRQGRHPDRHRQDRRRRRQRPRDRVRGQRDRAPCRWTSA